MRGLTVIGRMLEPTHRSQLLRLLLLAVLYMHMQQLILLFRELLGGTHWGVLVV